MERITKTSTFADERNRKSPWNFAMSKSDDFLEGMGSAFDLSGELYFNKMLVYRGSVDSYWKNSWSRLNKAIGRALVRVTRVMSD